MKRLKTFGVSLISIICLSGTVACSNNTQLEKGSESFSSIDLALDNYGNYLELLVVKLGYDGEDDLYNKCVLGVIISGLPAYTYVNSSISINYYTKDNSPFSFLGGDVVFDLTLSTKGVASYSKIVSLDKKVTSEDLLNYIDVCVSSINGEAYKNL